MAMKQAIRFAVAVLALVASTELVAQERRTLRRPSILDRAVRNSAQEASPASAAQASASTAQSKDPTEAPALNWDGAALDIVLQAYSEQTGKTILKDPAIPNPSITLKTLEGQKLTKEEYLEAIEVVLEMNGVHLSPYGEKFIRALPRKDVRKEGIPLIMDPTVKLGESGRVVSMMIPFKHIALEEAQKALEGFKSNSGILLVFERTNSILVTDTEQNINRMLEIARSIDIATPVLENVFVRQIKNASAAEIKTALEAIVQESQKELEKSGRAAKTASQAQAAPLRPSLLGAGGRLLNRTAQPQEPQPVNNASLVMSVSDADRGMIRGKVLILSDERSNKLIIVTQKTNMDFFDKVIEQLDIETIPDTVVKVYRLKYAEAEEVSDMINDLIGNASSSKSSSKSNQNRNAKSGNSANITRNSSQPAAAAQQRKSANQRTGESKPGELTKDNTTVLADKRINGLVVMTQKELVPVVEQIIESMDVKLSQVLIETVIVEVALSDSLKTGIDWFHGLNQKGKNYSSGLSGGGGTGAPRTGSSSTTSSSSSSGSGSNSESTSETITELSKDAVKSTPAGAGINYFVHSRKLDLSAIITASKTDSRTKYIASPIVMTVDNKEATIEATSSYQFLTGWSAVSSSYAGSGLPSPNYSAKDLGITLKIKPKINPNGTVMLNVEEEYSQLGTKQSMLQPKGSSYEPTDVETSVTRKMTSDIILEDRQSVVLGGMTTKNVADTEKGIPILKDIPWIGKWIFGSVEQTENRAELLIFMTPYVLDDSESAKAEAVRRKKTISDPRPWEDGGWSASDLADPISQKEQLRRLKDEWKKQDSERKTRQAIEQEKLNRARKLKELSKEERKVWLEMHKQELEQEKREELEEKMLDEKSQDELKKLVEDIKKEKLESAEKEIDAADKMMQSESERAKLDKAKAEKAEKAK